MSIWLFNLNMDAYLILQFMTLTDTRNPEKARELQDDMETAIAMHSNARAVALKAYKESVESGDPAAQDVGFPIWCDRNFPNVQALEENMRTTTAIFEAYTSGDGKPALTDTFYRNLTRAVTCVPAQPGLVQTGSTTSLPSKLRCHCLRY